MRAQIEAALAAGIDITHLDTHMGAAAAPEFAEIYLSLGREYRLPVLFPERIETYVSVLDMGPVDTDLYAQLQVEARAASMPAIDTFAMGLAMRHLGCEEAFRQMVEQAAPGRHLCVPALQHAGRGRAAASAGCRVADRRVPAVRGFGLPDLGCPAGC